MKREITYAPDHILFIILICAFTASVLMVLMLGIRIYTSTADASERLHNARTSTFYIAEKLRHGDERDAVYVADFDGLNALYIESSYDDAVYTNILYYSNGWLNELFCEKGADFDRSDGTKIIETGAVTFSEPSPGLFDVETVDLSGNISRLNICLRSGG